MSLFHFTVLSGALQGMFILCIFKFEWFTDSGSAQTKHRKHAMGGDVGSCGDQIFQVRFNSSSL